MRIPLTGTRQRLRHLTRIPLLVALAIACVAGEAAAQLHAVPITDPGAVYELEGYSVSPPAGTNWFEMWRDPQQALFGKKIASRTHSLVATATSVAIKEKFEKFTQFQDYVDKVRIAAVDPARYKIIEYHSEFDGSFPAWCVRYRSRNEDRGAPHAQGKALVLEHIGVACLHPTLPGLLIDVGYSERGSPAEISADLRAEGEGFMRSLKFTPR